MHDLAGTGASNEVVTARTSVGNGTSILAIGVKHNTVSARRTFSEKHQQRKPPAIKREKLLTPSVNTATEKREFLVRTTDTEAETLVVVVL